MTSWRWRSGSWSKVSRDPRSTRAYRRSTHATRRRTAGRGSSRRCTVERALPAQTSPRNVRARSDEEVERYEQLALDDLRHHRHHRGRRLVPRAGLTSAAVDEDGPAACLSSADVEPAQQPDGTMLTAVIPVRWGCARLDAAGGQAMLRADRSTSRSGWTPPDRRRRSWTVGVARRPMLVRRTTTSPPMTDASIAASTRWVPGVAPDTGPPPAAIAVGIRPWTATSDAGTVQANSSTVSGPHDRLGPEQERAAVEHGAMRRRPSGTL